MALSGYWCFYLIINRQCFQIILLYLTHIQRWNNIMFIVFCRKWRSFLKFIVKKDIFWSCNCLSFLRTPPPPPQLFFFVIKFAYRCFIFEICLQMFYFWNWLLHYSLSSKDFVIFVLETSWPLSFFKRMLTCGIIIIVRCSSIWFKWFLFLLKSWMVIFIKFFRSKRRARDKIRVQMLIIVWNECRLLCCVRFIMKYFSRHSSCAMFEV